MTLPETEKWKPVKGFEKNYEVSNLGRVRRSTDVKSHKAGNLLKARPQQKGYLIVKLWGNGKLKCKALHRLVAETFIPNPLNLPEVNHVGKKTDCRASMLEWRSRQGNMQHAVENDLRFRRGKVAGVTFLKRLGKWAARYYPEPNKSVWIGTYKTWREAVNARKEALASIPKIL